MLTVHHLENSRSQRILWLLEELGVDYDIKRYGRDKETSFAPPELQDVHPLGKAPVVDDDGQVVAESGAIIEYLVGKYDDGTLFEGDVYGGATAASGEIVFNTSLSGYQEIITEQVLVLVPGLHVGIVAFIEFREEANGYALLSDSETLGPLLPEIAHGDGNPGLRAPQFGPSRRTSAFREDTYLLLTRRLVGPHSIVLVIKLKQGPRRNCLAAPYVFTTELRRLTA